MAIATYSELQTAIQNWLDDSNTLTAARCQEFIALAEADMGRRIRVRDNLTSTTGQTVSGTATISLPSRFGGVQALAVSAGGFYQPLRQMAPMAALEGYYAAGNGEPQHYTMESGTLRLYPTPDGAYDYLLWYWEKPEPLSDSSPSNWILTGYPDIYLFGSLVQATAYQVNDGRAETWRARYEGAIEALAAQSKADGWGSGAFMYLEGGTP